MTAARWSRSLRHTTAEYGWPVTSPSVALPYRRGMPARKRPTPEDTVTARRALLDGLARDADIFELVSELAPLHPRNNTFPGEMFLHVAAPTGYSQRGRCSDLHIGPTIVTCLEIRCTHLGLLVRGLAPSSYSQPRAGRPATECKRGPGSLHAHRHA